jgi:hypothetical protein
LALATLAALLATLTGLVRLILLPTLVSALASLLATLVLLVQALISHCSFLSLQRRQSDNQSSGACVPGTSAERLSK